MKSLAVQEAPYLTPADKAKYSDLKVMESAAGFYVGTTYNDNGVEMPGSRDSGYYYSRSQAEQHLAECSESLGVRTCLEGQAG